MKMFKKVTLCFLMTQAAVLQSKECQDLIRPDSAPRPDYVPVRLFCDKVLYTKGGVFIQYPQGYFSSTPYVYISIELNSLEHCSDLSFTPIITSSGPTNATIFLNVHRLGYIFNSVVEADNDDVYLNIIAMGF